MNRNLRILALTLVSIWVTSPARASLRITGIIEGNPTEADTPSAALTLYKSLEFFTDTGVSSSELMKYALRRFSNADAGSATTFQLNPGANPALFLNSEEFGFAVVDNNAFRDLYFAGGLGGQNWANNTGQTAAPYPRILLQNAAIGSTGGNEVYQLLYYAGGFGVANPFTVVDTFGILGDPGASSWDYELSYAYRLNGTGPNGTSFNPANWAFGEAGMFQDDPLDPADGFDFEGHSSTVPFGTFVSVPEPSSLALLGLGFCLLRRARAR